MIFRAQEKVLEDFPEFLKSFLASKDTIKDGLMVDMYLSNIKLDKVLDKA